MPIDLRRCADAAVRAVIAEALARPEPKRSKRARRRRWRPVRMLLRAVRAVLMGVGLWTIVRTARDPKLRRETVEAVAQRFPVEELLEEIALELAAARAAVTGDPQSSEAASHRAGDQEEDDAAQRRRRPAPRRRGDRNGQRGRKPPNRGTRA